MDTKELLKKYWFVALIALVFVVFIGVYAKSSYDNREITVSNKQNDGKYVAYSVDGKEVYADDFYEGLYSANGLSSAFVQFRNAIINEAYETTDQMNLNATNYAAYYLQYYGSDALDADLKSMGYENGADDFVQYYIDYTKQTTLIKDYINNNWDELAKTYVDENDPRIIYHILVKVTDVESNENADGTTTYTANPTKEETDKLNKVLDALKAVDTMNIDEFSKTAYALTDDTGSAQNGGYIGLVGKDTNNLVKPFLDASLSLGANEVSEPIVSEYGYHIIYNAGSDNEALLNNTDFLSQIENNNPNIQFKALMEKADALGFEIVNEELKNLITTQIENGENQ